MSAEHWIAVAAVCVTIIGGFIGLGMLIISYINNIKDTLTSQLSVISHDIANLERFYDKRFEVIDERFEAINKRFEVIDERFEAINERFEEVNKRFEEVNKRFEEVNKRFDAVDNELILLRGEISRLNQNHIEHLTNHNK